MVFLQIFFQKQYKVAFFFFSPRSELEASSKVLFGKLSTPSSSGASRPLINSVISYDVISIFLLFSGSRVYCINIIVYTTVDSVL